MAADTSSAAAGSRVVVGAVAAPLAVLIAEPIPARSIAVAAKTSGAAITNDMVCSRVASSVEAHIVACGQHD
ncbi:hypothetical protein LAUMK191_00651 [Mycobacterium attenuatum]|nr:hypothetical protein LAUMK191_00651 [Mycobacterium attenuatum]